MWDPLPPSPWELLMAALLTLRFWMTTNWENISPIDVGSIEDIDVNYIQL